MIVGVGVNGVAMGAGLPRPALGKDLVDRLLGEETRADAFFEFKLALGAADEEFDQGWAGYPREIFDRAHSQVDVIECSQAEGGERLVAILYREDYSVKREFENLNSDRPTDAYEEHPEEIRRRNAWAKGGHSEASASVSTWRPGDPMLNDRVLYFLDADGKVCWPFGGNNMINNGCLQDINGDGILERVDYTNWGVAEGYDVQSLEVSTVEATPQVLLDVVFNWHPETDDDANRWGYNVADDDGDGLAEIGLGPVVGTFELRGPAEVTFRWDVDNSRYFGPPGGQGKHWQVLPTKESKRPWAKLKEMKGLGYPLLDRVPVVAVGGGGDNDDDDDIWQPPPLQEWPQRKPYQHQSLADLSDEKLFRFMWKGRLHLVEERERNGVTESDRRYARVPNEALSAEPREAALAIAEANRTDEHRTLYEFKFAVTEGEGPPESALMVMESLGGGWTPNVFTDGVRFDAAGGIGERVRCYNGESGGSYPQWRPGTAWYRDNIGAKAKWTAATVWWLDRLRTVSRIEHKVDDNDGFGGDDFPIYHLAYTAGWEDDGQPIILEFPYTQGYDNGQRWSGHYDRSIAASLTLALWLRLYPEEMERGGKKSEARDLGVVTHILENEEVLRQWPFVDFVRLAVQTAGDGGWKSLSEELEALQGKIPTEPDALEKRCREIEARIEKEQKANREGDAGAWEKAWEAQNELRDLGGRARLHPGIQLRRPIEIAQRQLAKWDNREALEKWALEENPHGAAWALYRLENFDKGAEQVDKILAVQTDAKAADNDWVFHELLRRNRSLAIETWRSMPLPRRNRLAVSIYQALDGEQQRAEEWVTVMVELLAADDSFLALNGEVQVIDLLVPRDESVHLSDPRIDQAIASCLRALNQVRWSNMNFSQNQLWLKAALALARRDSAQEYWELLVDTHERTLDVGSRHDGILRSGLAKIVAEHPELGQEFWLRMRLKDAHGNWDSLFFDLYAADLRLAKDDIARAATLSPSEREGSRANVWMSTEQTLKGGFHSARQVVALWEEPDELTRLKMQIAFGLRAVDDFSFGEVYRALDRLQKQVAAGAPLLSAEENAVVLRWVQWCREKAPQEVIGQRLSSKHLDWLSECQQLLQR